MTVEEFKPHMDRLTGVFQPIRWKPEAEAEYYRIVKDWDVASWAKAVSDLIGSETRMPRPHALKGRSKTISSSESRPDSCDRCFGGFVTFLHQQGDIKYEKVAACDCRAGQWWNSRKSRKKIKTYRDIFHSDPPLIDHSSHKPKIVDVCDNVTSVTM